jgi:hypothetical protein
MEWSFSSTFLGAFRIADSCRAQEAMPIAILVVSRMPAAKQSRPRLFLIDSFGFVFRAYHARARSAAAGPVFDPHGTC